MKNRIDCAENNRLSAYLSGQTGAKAQSSQKTGQARERALKLGVDSLSDLDLVQLILGYGTRQRGVAALAADVLLELEKQAGSQSPADLRKGTENLLGIHGIGSAKALKLSACFELVRRFSGRAGIRIRSPKDLIPYLMHWADRPQENFLIATLNGAHELISVRRLTTGTLNRTLVHPREVFAVALQDRAAALIVAHNHPSGNLEISPDDESVTRRLKSVGELIGIPLLDHLIFAPSAWVSLAEAGKMN